MRKILLATIVLLLAMTAGVAAAEPAPPAAPVPAVAAPTAQAALMTPAVGLPEPLFASSSSYCNCTGDPTWCACIIFCCEQQLACEAACPPLGAPGHFNCLANCRRDYMYCSVCPLL